MRKSGTHLLPIAAVLDPAIDIRIEFLTPPIPRARATQICTTNLGGLEEPPCGRPGAQLAIILGSRIGIEFTHEGLECGSIGQGWEQVGSARRGRRRWRDGSRVGQLVAHSLSFATLFWAGYLRERKKAGNGDVHDARFYNMQFIRQRAELYANEL